VPGLGAADDADGRFATRLADAFCGTRLFGKTTRTAPPSVASLEGTERRSTIA